MVKINRYQDFYANYDTKYMAEVSHEGLNEFRVLSDRDDYILENKVNVIAEKWNKKWKTFQDKLNKQNLIKDLNEKVKYLNEDAENKISRVENILNHTLNIDDTINWEELKDYKVFYEKKPSLPVVKLIDKIDPNNSKYQPTFDFWDKIFSNRKNKKLKYFKNLYDIDYSWYEKKNNEYNSSFEIEMKNYTSLLEEIEKRKNEHNQRQIKGNEKIEFMKEKYLEKDTESVIEYCSLVLSNSNYPSEFPQSFEIEYDSNNESIIVEYWLPEPEDIPKYKEYKFIASKKEIKEYPISETQRKKLYDSAIYQIALRSIHELFEADSANALNIITFNGWVNFINRANGKKETACIISLQTNKLEFLDIDLKFVDPKECFKSLKGVGSSKLYGLTPVKPIIQMDRNDSRIVSHYDVAHTLDDSVNLAAMNWEDFEHLIREIFAKEFSGEGGEVRVTKASKDGGVDAIAFDPDPIRGGKIVIQAKRYTNTVGVSAVRDLFGTVVNEGANKGILVTTANYGPDAYSFAKGKPLTLLSGSNLLHLLSKHGYAARINLKEAKELQ